VASIPRGIDVYFDNTSGTIVDAVWPLMNVRGRIIQCGTAAVATWEPPPTAPRREREILTKRQRDHSTGEIALDGPATDSTEPGKHRTPVPKLYMTAGSTHPGGGVTGGPGRNATQIIMEDLGLDFEKTLA
jgi:hypothetical protein